ncbi:MAG: hypothetical protein ACLS9A_10005 [Clostridia bacterium]
MSRWQNMIKQLEKDILSDYKSVKEFLRNKILNPLEIITNRQKVL